MNTRANWFIATVAIACFAAGVVLSQRNESGVRVETVTIGTDTPALKFSPADAGPHPVVLLAHGFAGQKENLFCYGEALAAAGFVCFSVDQPGHGASPRLFSLVEAVRTLGEVAHAIGPVDVFLGWSMGGITGGEAVREGRLRPKLFIALGSDPHLGGHAPPLLFLAGQFDEAFPASELKARTDARLVLSPWSDHLLEGFDPLLVNAAVKASCVAVGKTPPPPSTWLVWRFAGMALAVFGAVKLAYRSPDFFPRLAPLRGLLTAIGFIVAFVLTLSPWANIRPHPQQFALQIAAIVISFVVLIGAGKLRIPRWSFFVLAALVLAAAVVFLKVDRSYLAVHMLFFALTLSSALFAGTILGGLAARRGSRLQGDIAMAIIVGCGLFYQVHLPRFAPEVPKPHVFIKLEPKLCDACAGQYEFPPDNVFRGGAKLAVWRRENRMFLQATGPGTLQGEHEIFPESETNFLLKINGAELTFIKNATGEVTGVIHHMDGLPDSEGEKLSDPATDGGKIKTP